MPEKLAAKKVFAFCALAACVLVLAWVLAGAAGGDFLWIRAHSPAVATLLALLLAGAVAWNVRLYRRIGLLEAHGRKSAEEFRDRERSLRHDMLHDPVTGLPNRFLFLDRLDRIIKRSHRVSDYAYTLLLLDLDGFRMINESLGHSVGDEVLSQTGERIVECCREVDAVARLGGDEFAVLLEDDLARDGAVEVVERILASVARPFYIDGNEIYVSVSIGVVFGGTHYEFREQVFRDAETAMNRSKEKGRGAYQIFQERMHVQAVNTMRTVTDMRRAMERNEFFLQYQPILRLRTAELVGFEALIRWRHPERGLVPPGQFIPLAESTGLIVPIGDWVLEEASRQAVRVQEAVSCAGCGACYVAVNISVPQLSGRDLAQTIGRLLATHGLRPQSLKLEITETLLMRNAYSVIPMLEQLRALGTRLAIDDFGTGYSSLSYLHYLPVDTLKIDKSFVDDVATDSRIVQTILGLAESMGMSVVAEGVETQAQAETLDGLGCGYVQGFLFGRPMDLEAALELIRRTRGTVCAEGEALSA
jgi:Amt family ammonium transporter